MIAKTSIGKSFGSALEYGAGLKEGKQHKPSQLLGASNLGARDPQGMAAEMIAAASGVGYLIMQAGNFLNTSIVFAGIITIAMAGLALDAILRRLVTISDPSRRR